MFYDLYKGDCLELIPLTVPTASVDLILCDLPYGTTETKWDKVIPFEKLWEQYERVIKPNGAILLFSSQNFTVDLINSNRKLFKYFMIWDKKVAGSFSMAQVRPMLVHEEICVFSKANIANGSSNNMNYFPILKDAKLNNIRPINNGSSMSEATFGKRKNVLTAKSKEGYDNKKRYPKSIIEYSKYNAECNNTKRQHPTQKPVKLLEELISLFTKEGMIVLDNCMGVGSTGVACVNLGRSFIGIELNETFYKIAMENIKKSKSCSTCVNMTEDKNEYLCSKNGCRIDDIYSEYCNTFYISNSFEKTDERGQKIK